MHDPIVYQIVLWLHHATTMSQEVPRSRDRSQAGVDTTLLYAVLSAKLCP